MLVVVPRLVRVCVRMCRVFFRGHCADYVITHLEDGGMMTWLRFFFSSFRYEVECNCIGICYSIRTHTCTILLTIEVEREKERRHWSKFSAHSHNRHTDSFTFLFKCQTQDASRQAWLNYPRSRRSQCTAMRPPSHPCLRARTSFCPL